METHLASMENITCWAFRKLCPCVSDSYTGMLSLTNLIKRDNTWDEIDSFQVPGQRQWIQVATSKETECSAFLKKLEEKIKENPQKDHIYGIQLNASCPSPNLIKIGQGPALIKRVTKLSNLLKELLKQNKYKVGIKLRLGLNDFEVKQRKIFTLFKELQILAKENPNFTNVTIHFKHAQESSSTKYDYTLLNELASYNLPIIINGGIKNFLDFKKLFESISNENKKNIKGVMLGRAALNNPDCFMDFYKESDLPQSNKRNLDEIKAEFSNLCKIHMPKDIYLKTINDKIKI